MQQRMRPWRAGFSLVELAVVIVMIGVLMGGVLVGQNMLHNAKLKTIISDIAHYKDAYNVFRERYNAAPGDFKQATSVWGAVSAGATEPVNCPDLYTNGHETCNGNGDGNVNNSTFHQVHESLRAWQHLASAGLVNVQYTGTRGTSPYTLRPGVNVPAAPLTGGIYEMYHARVDDAVWGSQWGNLLVVSAGDVTFTNYAKSNTPIMRPKDVYAIDTKIDDGQPLTGDVVGRIFAYNTPGCVSGSQYNLGDEGEKCPLGARLQKFR